MSAKKEPATTKALRNVNIVLLVFVVAVGVIGIRGLLARGEPFEFVATFEEPQETVTASEPEALLDLNQYLSIVNKKRLFKKGVRPTADRATRVAQQKTIQELAAPLELVGIVGGSEPQVMIKNARTKRTYSLKQGEYIGELLIQEIRNNSAILMYENETLELKL